MLRCRSFTSDGRHSVGERVEAADLPQPSLVFVADMPAGRARQAYWPGDDGTLVYVVESVRKDGFTRFLEHRYTPL
jgi:hypothetical protein